MYKPLFNHDDEVNSVVDSITNLLQSNGFTPVIEYGNLFVHFSFTNDDNMSLYEVYVVDCNDDDENEMLNQMFDGNVIVEFYRNDQIIAKFNAVFTVSMIASIKSVFDLFKC